MKLSVVFTGGGSGGHVTANIALIHYFQTLGWQIYYIGSDKGVEKGIIEGLGIPYYSVKTGKFRRYLSFKTLFEPFKIALGIIQSYILLKKFKSKLVFSKGGFVAFPVVVGAWLSKIPVIAHESDFSPGLANKLCYPFIDKLCVNFEETKNYFKKNEKIFCTGTPIRQELLNGNKVTGLSLCGFNETKPVVLIIGGSLGSENLNYCIRKSLTKLSEKFQIIHLCGKGKVDAKLLDIIGYCQLEYANEELPHFFAASEIVISRAGANSLFEILALGKPHILIPLSKKYSRGDQIQNAKYFNEKGVSIVIEEEELNTDILIETLKNAFAQKEIISNKIKSLGVESGTQNIVNLLHEVIQVN